MNKQINKMGKKLAKLKEGSPPITVEERQQTEQAFNLKIAQWRRRKRIFKELWDMITESMPRSTAEFKVWL